MKTSLHVLGAFLLLLAGLCDLSAQSSSSATQTVTFGVRRLAPVLLASAQVHTPTLAARFVNSANPLKVTIGIDSKVETNAEMSATSLDRPVSIGNGTVAAHTGLSEELIAAQQARLPLTKFPDARAENPDQRVITLTE
jgi:hypothetical protein